ncbi:hypothetical protein RJ55_04171 [Drechmeria coniospora]|nr:hypothetical protein RJ55_04171 [Drechmeria coniospora]
MEDDDSVTHTMSMVKLEVGAANGPLAGMDHGGSMQTPYATNGHSPSPSASLNGLKSRTDDADTSISVSAPVSSKPPTLSRKSSQKLANREPQLFDHLPDATSDSCKTFQVIPDCLYGSKNLGSTDHDALDCDCREEWRDGENAACGEDSDCINRATKMECSADTGNCSGGCHNQRFQRKQWGSVSVIRTAKKGFGLRADVQLHANEFIYEYIGEVINEPTFRRRMLQYDNEGIKHFYFMSLNKSVFVDATKKGNLGRFCNHSCSPNCYVDKWVVGDKLRMGIFALRSIRAGEELVFNYNVDRYGADPQPCYCAEPNCVGFIGGKTQTERATKLPAAIVEALGIDDSDGWDTAVAKKPRKKRPDEDDEEYVNSIQPRSLDDDDARKVMAALMQCKEKWIAVKLLERIQRCDEERVIHCVVRMHAYQILKTSLNTFIEDHNVVLQVLEILDKFPRLTRNKIQDSNIETTIESLGKSEHEAVASRSKQLLDDWSKLEVAYRIRRRKVDPNAPVQNLYEQRRGGQPRDEDTAQLTPKTVSPRPIDAPKGPRSSVPQRNNSLYFNAQRQRRPPLPDGWFAAKDDRGNTYFYTKSGMTTWQRPTLPATDAAQRGPSKAMQEQLAIQSIIDRVTKEGTPKQTPSQPKEAVETPSKESKRDKWRTLPLEKQMKIYENTVFPPVKHVLDKFRHKLPKDELKRLGKEIAKKLVASDYKNNRVEDPTVKLSEKQVQKIKKYVADFLGRAVEKFDAHRKQRGTKDKLDSNRPSHLEEGASQDASLDDLGPADDGNDALDTPPSDAGSPDSQDRKRKRDADLVESAAPTPSEGPEMKRVKAEEGNKPHQPPPPPPPPESAPGEGMTDEQRDLQEQEEALMRENEEAQRLEDEANSTKMEEVSEDTRTGITLTA